MFYLKYCPLYSSSCVWHKSWSNHAYDSASSYTFGLPLRYLSSMSNSPFLNFWSHSQKLLSLKAASQYVSTSNRCASDTDLFKLKKYIKVSTNDAFWLKTQQFRTQKNILDRWKFTNISRLCCWQMSNLMTVALYFCKFQPKLTDANFCQMAETYLYTWYVILH